MAAIRSAHAAAGVAARPAPGPQSNSPNGIAVSVGYADNSTTSANFPDPWQGAPNVVFVGGGTTFNAGAIRLDNTTSSPINVDSVAVDLQRPGPQFSLWSNVTIPANGSAILTQTQANNFVTSGYPIVGCGQPIPQGNAQIPKITVTISGSGTDYLDTAHVLDTGGFDLGCRGNRSLEWRPIGTAGIESPGASIALGPDGSISETGTQATFTAQAMDAAGQPLGNAVLNFSVISGPNVNTTGSNATNSSGSTTFAYSSGAPGADQVQALLTNLTGASIASNQITVNWSGAGACPAPTGATQGSTTLIYLGQTSIEAGDSLQAAAILTDNTGMGLVGKALTFALGSQMLSAPTDSGGTAQVALAGANAGSATLTVSFAGDSTSQPTSTTANITINREDTALLYTGPTLLGTGTTVQLSATLLDPNDNSPIPNEPLVFQIGTAQVSATTNATGSATASLALGPAEANGPGQVQITFAGDANHNPASASNSIVVYLSSQFVIWGGNAGGLQLGQDVNFWGAQWANQVIGGDFTGNPSFKGYAATVSQAGLCLPLVGSGQGSLDDRCWSSKGGNSSPPATLPKFIGVIVSTAITKSGSEIFGNTASLAVLSVDLSPAYANNPGHPGYGHIVALIADGASVFPMGASLAVTQSQPATVLPGQNYAVTAQVTNSGQTTATNVTVSESFDGTTPATGLQSTASLAGSNKFTASFSEAAPTYPARQSSETTTQYESRLAAVDGRLFTSTGTITLSDAAGEPYLPVSAISFSKLQLPRLTVSLTGPSCINPNGTIPYQVKITNLGSAAASAVSGTLTLPDGSTKLVSAATLGAGMSSVTAVNFQVAAIAPKGSNETTSAYLARLASVDGVSLVASVAVTWQDANGNAYGSVVSQTSTATQHVPIVSQTATSPAPLLLGSQALLSFSLQNTGGGNSIETDLSVTNPDGSISKAAPFTLLASQNTTASTTWHVPSVSAKKSGETDAAYQARLQSVDNTALNFGISLAWKDAAGNVYGPASDSAKSTEILPVVAISLTGPATANSGAAISYSLSLQNTGHATANPVSLNLTPPGGSSTSIAVSGGLASGATFTTSVPFTISSTQTGNTTATAQVTWQDASGNNYGPLSASATTQVTSANLPPAVSAGPNQTIELPVNSVTLQGSATSVAPEGSPVTVQWSEVSGPSGVTFATPTNPVTQATFPAAGTYVLQLTGTVTATGLSASAQTTVLVAPVNQPPSVSAGADQTITLPTTTVTLNGTASDDGNPPGSVLVVTWSKVAGPGPVVFSNPSAAVTQASFSVPGTYVLRLTASDSLLTNSSDVRVTLNSPPGGALVANAGPNQIVVFPSAVTLNGLVADSLPLPGGTPTVQWSEVSGPGTASFANAASPATTATFDQDGVYDLRLTATDGSLTSTSDVLIFEGHVSCTESNTSTDFWLMFTGALADVTSTTPPRELDLFISGDAATAGVVAVPGIGFSSPFSVIPGQVTKIVLPQTAQMTTSDAVENKGIHVTAQNPVAVYGMNFVPFATDGYMALPTPVLGTDYLTLSYRNTTVPNGGSLPAFGTEFGIAATQDSTTVMITPATTAGARTIGVPYTITLNQGQTYQLRNKENYSLNNNQGGTPVDLTGSIISSDKPIAVFAGHDCTSIPSNNQACNSLIEQMPPTNLWGQYFVTMPLSGEHNGDTFRYLAGTDDTHVSVNGIEVAHLNRGQYFEQIVQGPSFIAADHPVLVAQYANSEEFAANSGADPSMAIVPPFTQFGGSYTVTAPMPWFTANYINVVASANVAATGGVSLDGNPIPPSAWVAIGTTGFSGTQVAVNVGSHTVSGTEPFGILSYGFTSFDAYSYTGGVCLATGLQNGSLTLSPKTATDPITVQQSIAATVKDAFGNPQGGIGVAFSVTGVNPTTITIPTDATGTATLTYRGLHTGSDLVSATAGTASDTASISWVSNGPNQAPVVNAGPNQTIGLPVNSTLLPGTVIDDGLPIGGTLTSQWSELSGPAAVTFANASQPSTVATFTQPGAYVLQLSASDSQLSSSATTTITVLPLNQPPVVNAGPNQQYFLGTGFFQLTGTATDDGLPQGSTLTVNWSELFGPDSPTLLPNAQQLSVSVLFTVPGSYGFQLCGNDTQYTTCSLTNILVHPLPTVTAGGPYAATVGVAIQLQGTATSDGFNVAVPPNSSWSLTGGISPPGNVSFDNALSPTPFATFSAPGVYSLSFCTLTVCAKTTVSVVPVGVTAPSVSITSPTDSSEITKPAAISGNVSGGNWTLAYALQGDFHTQQFVTIATGSGAVTNAALGTLDPTLLLNGTYVVQLSTVDQYGQIAFASITVSVTRNMKVGVFSLSFNDLTVPVAGIPIQIIRSYDSRDKSVGDFGIGWHLSLTNIRLQKNHNMGLNWSETVNTSGFLPQYCLQPNNPSTVTVVFPGGKTYRFLENIAQPCQLAGPIVSPTVTFAELPGTAGTNGATLAPADGGFAVIDGSVPGPVNLLGFDGNLYNPTAFILTTLDHTQYAIDQKLGLTSVTDPNGNTITISPNGITSSTGVNVPIIRDLQGRITQITDPDGHQLVYFYTSAGPDSINGNLGAFTDASHNTTTFAYDQTTNLLTGINNAQNQNILANTYDASGRLTQTQNRATGGSSVSFTHNVAAQTETVTDALGNATTYAYDGDGNIIQTTDALGHITSATYDADDNKLTETNGLGKTTTYTYDTNDNRTSEADPLGNTTSYTYSGFGKVLTVSDPNHHTTTNTYDQNGNLLTTTDPLSGVTTNTYNPNGTLASTQDALNHQTLFTYNGAGNLASQTDANGTVTSYTYDSNGNRLTQSVTRTTPGGPQTLLTQYQYDGNNRLTKTINPDGTNTQTAYNNLGQQSATTDARGNQTTYQYDGAGHVTKIAYPDNTSEQTGYDSIGRRSQYFARNGVVTQYTYDAASRLTQTTVSGSGAITKTFYDAAGQVTSTIDPRSNTTQYAYDDAGRRTQITDALSHVTTFAYDAAGNQASVTDALNHTTTYTYDAANRRTQVTYPDTTFETTGYDALGRVTSRTDANGKATQYGYDALGRLTSVTDALNQITRYAYDEVGNRISQTDANNHTTTFQYDQRGRRIGRTLPAGQSESFTYDPNGNLLTHTDFNGKVTTFAYDAGNRLLSKTPDASFAAPAVTYTYNNQGLRFTMNDASGTTTYFYDSAARLTQLFKPEGSLFYTLDPAGNLTNLGGPNNVSYSYDALNRLSTVQETNTGTTSYAYDAVGDLQSVTYPNGVVHSYSYDTKNRLTNVSAAGGAGANAANFSYAYTLDNAGHRTAVTEQSGRHVNYSYDNLYRLTNETVASDPNGVNGAISYTYDPVGNRTNQSSTLPGITSGGFGYDADDRLSSDLYDANGNTVNSGGVGNVYDFENHLVQQGGATIVYDGDGNRVSKTVAGVTTKFLVSDANPTGYAQVLSETFSGGTGARELSHTFVYGLDRISQFRSVFTGSQSFTQTSYYIYDGHGSVRALTDPSGNVTDTYDYDAFGNQTHSATTLSTPTVNEFLFAGEQYDSDLHLYYNRARYLNVATGRFLTIDVLKDDLFDPENLHLYTYAVGDPVDKADPSGEDSIAEEAETAQVLNVLFAITTLGLLARALTQSNVRIEAPFRANHYTTWAVLPLIMIGGINSPFGRNFVTTDYYLFASDAKAKLALATKPQVVINLFVFKYKDSLDGPETVTAKNGEPGGGSEYSTSQPIPFWTRAPIVFPLIP